MATSPSVYTERAQQLQDQRWKDQRDVQLTPLQESLRADQTRLALYANPDDPTKPLAGKEAEYNATHDRMAQTIGQMRQLYGQKPQGANPVEAALGNVADKLHITNHLKNHVAQVRAENAAKYNDQTNQMTGQYAVGAVAAPNPYLQSEAQMRAAGFSEPDIQQAIRAKAGLIPKDATEQERFVTSYKQQHPGSTDEDALKAYTKATEKPTAPKGLKAVEAGGIPVAVQDQDTGTQYLPSQLTSEGNAPPEAKQMWKTIQDAKLEKQKQEQRKEDEVAQRQARTIAAGFERMGQTQQFQELMTQYRSDLQTYRALNTAADQSDGIVKSLEYQYRQPGNKSVADNELQNFYTTVVQKGGRKTAAELNLTLKIGSLGMNIQQMATKAAKGELPDQLRKMLLDGMKSVTEEQRNAADAAKPELPQITAPEGPKTRALKQTARGGWTPPADAPAAPKQDGKLLKANGKVVAVSKGGNWTKPPNAD